ncbi:MAG: hypothetical protein R3F28_06905 [Candidatus Kapaibacterium sp.]
MKRSGVMSLAGVVERNRFALQQLRDASEDFSMTDLEHWEH